LISILQKYFRRVKLFLLTNGTFFSIILFMKNDMRFLKEKLGTWGKVAEFLDITERYCLMITKTGKAGKHLKRIIQQKVELFK